MDGFEWAVEVARRELTRGGCCGEEDDSELALSHAEEEEKLVLLNFTGFT